MMNQQENKNSLPKYWVVQCNTKNPNWRKVIDYLKNVHGEKWDGDVDGSYYGYDGSSCWNGTNVYNNISEFRNSPVVLTIEEFVEMTEKKVEFAVGTYLVFLKNYGSSNIGDIDEIIEDETIYTCYCAKEKTTTKTPDYVKWFATKEQAVKFSKTLTNKQEETMKTITHTQAQQIIDIACRTWKERLFIQWGKAIVLKQSIGISDNDYQKMREACTSEQNQLFDEIFGKDKPKFKAGDWVYIGKSGNIWNSIVQLTRDADRKFGHAITKQGDETWFCVEFIERLATEEEIQKAKYIPKGTPCLVRDNIGSWKFAYSNGDGRFTTGAGYGTWGQVQVLDINNLPKY